MMCETDIFNRFLHETHTFLNKFANEFDLPKPDTNIVVQENGGKHKGDFSINFVSPKLVVWQTFLKDLCDKLIADSVKWTSFSISSYKIVDKIKLIQLFIDRKTSVSAIINNSFVSRKFSKNIIIITDLCDTTDHFITTRTKYVSNCLYNVLFSINTSVIQETITSDNVLENEIYKKLLLRIESSPYRECNQNQFALNIKKFLNTNHLTNSITTSMVLIPSKPNQLFANIWRLYEIISKNNFIGGVDESIIVVTPETNAYRFKLAFILLSMIYELNVSFDILPIGCVLCDYKFDQYITQLQHDLIEQSDKTLDRDSEIFKTLESTTLTLTLLATHPSTCIKRLNSNIREAIFIQYNCARLSTLIKRFEKEYSNNKSGKQLDLSLLVDDSEWFIIFNYFASYNSMICALNRQIIDDKKFNLNRILVFLRKLVTDISVYYKKVKVLIEPCDHLLPLIEARVYFCKMLFETLSNCLHIFGLKSIDFL